MAPRTAPASATLTPIEMRLGGGMLAINRLVMTFMNKRMPVASFTVGRDGWRTGALRATILLDCPEETARRYATLLGGLEDVEEIEVAEGTLEVALLDGGGDALRESAGAAGIKTHETEPGGAVVASGDPESMEGWLGSLEDGERDIIRLGPVVRPGDGG
ncbi:MAG TPA: hypothetical protein VK869_10720 [Rubrobacteraceae bacterium]|nr:hypothetical protein [Rubrobacteraceae bacterium]